LLCRQCDVDARVVTLQGTKAPYDRYKASRWVAAWGIDPRRKVNLYWIVVMLQAIRGCLMTVYCKGTKNEGAFEWDTPESVFQS